MSAGGAEASDGCGLGGLLGSEMTLEAEDPELLGEAVVVAGVVTVGDKSVPGIDSGVHPAIATTTTIAMTARVFDGETLELDAVT